MMYSLPSTKTEAMRFLSRLFQKVKEFFGSKKVKYRVIVALDLTLIFVILIYGRQPAKRLISPLVSSLNSFYSVTAHKTTSETFAFVPDLARNKFPRISLEGLSALSFFDIPLTTEGEINYYSKGYASFTSGEAAELFDRARFQKTKVFLTLSSLDSNIVKNLLNNSNAQIKLANQAIEEISSSNIDGITVDFELPGRRGKDYQEKFTGFIRLLTERIHNVSPGTQVAVAIPSSSTNNESLYNLEDLSNSSDRIFLIASNFIVPEVKNNNPSNPVFGFDENEYWSVISNLLSSLQNRIPFEKLVMERAWYGNGNQYPLYTPKNMPEPEPEKQPSSIVLDPYTIERLVAGVPRKGREGARKNIPLIAEALRKEGILDSNVLAYALATIEHETDETFQPIGEIQGHFNARRYGYEGGSNYFGRGFIQITHLRNYRKFGERIGLGDQLVKNPELASTPEVAARILAAFFKDNNVANLASRGNFVAARTPVNPDINARSVARMALKYGI